MPSTGAWESSPGREAEIKSSDDGLVRDIEVLERSAPLIKKLLSTLKAQRNNQAKIKKAVQAIVDDLRRNR